MPRLIILARTCSSCARFSSTQKHTYSSCSCVRISAFIFRFSRSMSTVCSAVDNTADA